MTEKQNIEATLDRIVELKKKYFENGNMFNFLATINKVNDEVSHSAILAELLNPSGTHGQGIQILKEFIEISAIKIDSPLENAIVRTEHFCKEENGRIDILLSFGKKECIIIENKVFASDQPEQLARYNNWANREQFNRVHLVYLTPEGELPSEQSRKGLDLDQIVLLSYREHIKMLLRNCQTILNAQPRIRFILCEYETTINKFLGIMNESLSGEIKSLLKTNKYDEIIPELEQAIIDYKTDIQYEFWKRMVEHINKSGISSEKTHLPPSRKDILGYYQRDSKPRIILEWPIIGFEHLGLKLKLQIMTNFAYGFSPVKINELPQDKLAEILPDERFVEDTTRQNWLAWKYPSHENEKLDFKNLNKYAIDISKSDKLESIANEIIRDVQSLKIINR